MKRRSNLAVISEIATLPLVARNDNVTVFNAFVLVIGKICNCLGSQFKGSQFKPFKSFKPFKPFERLERFEPFSLASRLHVILPMYKGIYIALSGAVLKQTQMEVISQNLANADTIGYKKDSLSFRDYLMPQEIISPEPDGRAMSYISSFRTDFSNGNLAKTGAPLDIAIVDSGFIALEGRRYTRRGDLKKDSDGYLTSYNGLRVIGNNGPIRLPEGKVEISEAGSISVNGIQIDSIKILNFGQTENLAKIGEGLFFTNDDGVKSMTAVKQGYLEKSNVDVIKEMVRMIKTLREFESYQKAIRTFDEASAKVINEIGRI